MNKVSIWLLFCIGFILFSIWVYGIIKFIEESFNLTKKIDALQRWRDKDIELSARWDMAFKYNDIKECKKLSKEMMKNLADYNDNR